MNSIKPNSIVITLLMIMQFSAVRNRRKKLQYTKSVNISI